MNTGKKFKVGIYLRLSKEDDDYKEESASITNQRDYIMNYLRVMKEELMTLLRL